MKKTISVLSLLLFILIVTCAYQKSATIYTDSLAEQPTPMDIIETDTLIVIKESANTGLAPIKEKAIVAKTIEKQIEVKTPAESTGEEEEAEQTLLGKLKSTVLKKLQSFDTKIKEEETAQSKTLLDTQNHQEVKDLLPKIAHSTSEEEIVDHLVEALKQQELAFKNRDKFMLEIEALIKRALDDRHAAIVYRNKEELALEKTQKVILDERDLNTKKIPEPYTINPGE
ncbi:MAG: hypothetical protein COB07_10510 [Sulfurovum sp.]|nr:MAG: hypothetical protein COB07_10510 [Sulfurovum sp.]